MTRFLQAGRWRRAVMLCGASALLHFAVLNAITGQLSGPGAEDDQASPVVASLHVEAEAPKPPAQVSSAASPAAVAPEAAQRRTAPTEHERQSSAGPGYRVALPPAAELRYDVTRIDAQGVMESGEGALIWHRDADSYRVEMTASVAHGALWEVASAGQIGAAGIAPRTLREKRRGRSAVATHFDHERRQILFSSASMPALLQAGVQDSASFLLQLAGIASADSTQLSRGVDMLVAGARDVQAMRLMLAGEEVIDTEMGRTSTWRVQRPVPHGSYNAYLEVWLAPDYHWYPVRVRTTEANGAVTTQTIRSIVIKEN